MLSLPLPYHRRWLLIGAAFTSIATGCADETPRSRDDVVVFGGAGDSVGDDSAGSPSDGMSDDDGAGAGLDAGLMDCDTTAVADLDGVSCRPGEMVLADGTCSTRWICPAGWTVVAQGYGCAPAAKAPVCATGETTLPNGRCMPAWPCPPSWVPSSDGRPGCEPPALQGCADGSFALPDGTCSLPWVCPDGWQRVEDETGCVPDGICGPGTVPTSAGGCRPVFPDDAVCPEVGFGDGPWPEGAIFVLPGAPPGGDGSVQQPLGGLIDAIEHVRRGGTIVLGVGVHEALSEFGSRLHVDDDVSIRGACRAEVLVDGGFTVDGALTIESVTLRSEGRPAIRSGDAGAQVTLRDVRVESRRATAIRIDGGDLVIEGVQVSSSAPLPVEERADASVAAIRLVGSTLRGSGLEVQRADRFGLDISGGQVRLSESRVAGPAELADPGNQVLIVVRSGAQVELNDLHMHTARSGIVVAHPGSRAHLRRFTVRLQGEVDDVTQLEALTATNGASLVVENGWVHDYPGRAVSSMGQGSAVELERVRISSGQDNVENAVLVYDGGALDVTHLEVVDCPRQALTALSDQHSPRLSGHWISVRRCGAELEGGSPTLLGSSAVSIDGGQWIDSFGAAILALNSELSLSRVTVRGARPHRVEGPVGGVFLQGGVHTVSDLRIADAYGTGVQVVDTEDVHLDRVVVEHLTLAHRSDGHFRAGVGIQVERSTLDLNDAWIEGVPLAAFQATRSNITARGVVALGGQPGLLIRDDTAATLERIRVTGARASGAEIGGRASVDAQWLWLDETTPEVGADRASGLHVVDGDAHVTNAFVLRNAGYGIAAEANADVEIDGLVALANDVLVNDHIGALTCSRAGRLHVRDASIRTRGESGLLAGPGCEVSLQRVVMDEGHRPASPKASFGVHLWAVRRATLTDVVVSDFADGVLWMDGGEVAINRLLARRAGTVDSERIGLQQHGGVLTVHQAALYDLAQIGLLVRGKHTSADLSGVRIDGIREGREISRGIQIHSGAQAILRDSVLSGVPSQTIDVNRGALTARRITLTGSGDTRPMAFGLSALDAPVSVCGLRVTDFHTAGVFGLDKADVALAGVESHRNGRGIWMQFGSWLDLNDFHVADSRVVGVEIDGARADLRHGRIELNPIGIREILGAAVTEEDVDVSGNTRDYSRPSSVAPADSPPESDWEGLP